MVVLIVMLITIVKKERKKMIKQSCKLDIVIPSLGRKVKLERCIESIRKAKFQHDVHLYLYFSIKEELDYFKKDILQIIFSSFIAIELENSIQEQLKIRDYIFDLLKNK